MTAKFIPKFLALLAFILLFAGYKVNATHYAGADMTVQYIGTDSTDLRYKVILDVYFSCSSVSTTPAGEVFYFSKNAGDTPYDAATNISLQTTIIGGVPGYNGDIIHQLCPQYQSQVSCIYFANQNLPGFRVMHNEGIVTLPSRQSDWVFYWSASAKNGDTRNIANPQNTLFIDAGFDNLARYNNATPVFKTDWLSYKCSNVNEQYLVIPFDSLGDSLVVSNVVPRMSYNSFYGYDVSSGCTPANPVGSVTGYTMNTTTGAAKFNIPVVGFYTLAYRIDKYDRNTKKITGFANRDVQIVVMPCNSESAIMYAPKNISPASSIYSNDTLTTYANTKLDFDIPAGNYNVPNQLLYMQTSVSQIPGANITLAGNGSDSVTGKFSWTPVDSNIGYHILYVRVDDSTCDANTEIVRNDYKVITIKVLAEPVGIKEMTSGKFIIAPNPTNDIVNINSELFLSGNYKIDIINSIGQVVYSTKTTRNARQQVSLATFSNGMYIIQLTSSDGEVYRQKLLKH